MCSQCYFNVRVSSYDVLLGCTSCETAVQFKFIEKTLAYLFIVCCIYYYYYKNMTLIRQARLMIRTDLHLYPLCIYLRCILIYFSNKEVTWAPSMACFPKLSNSFLFKMNPSV